LNDTPKHGPALRAIVVAGLLCALVSIAGCIWRSACGVLQIELEHRFARRPPAATDGIAGIIVLGGEHQRVVEAVRLARELPKTKLIVTGASPGDEAYARSQGFAGDRLVIEPYARTTFQNAIFTRKILLPKDSQKWLVVTSAIHMPRAVGAFREAGFSVVPWPVFDQPPAGSGAAATTLHEAFGLLGYWLLGWSDSLFPSPQS
jgi:uncharacterized SAM-binding protein YcdF (DUF218 family)